MNPPTPLWRKILVKELSLVNIPHPLKCILVVALERLAALDLPTPLWKKILVKEILLVKAPHPLKFSRIPATDKIPAKNLMI